MKVFGTREWASKTLNVVEGCSHDCWYCYARGNAVRFGRRKRDDWAREVMKPEHVEHICRGRPCKVMFPSAHDITPENVPVCLEAIRRMLDHGHDLLLVTKPHIEVVQALCTAFAGDAHRILFRFTIGSAQNDTLRLWEPGAPPFEERLASLRLAHSSGFQTSVSCEPMLDDNVEAVVSHVSPFVTDAIWIGKANQLRARLRVNGAGPEIMQRGEELIASQNDDSIRDLYLRLKDNSKIKWKESIKKVVGIEVPQKAGLDI